MSLVTSVSFSVLFNGTPLDEFHPSRGLRQGDPISPYLFLIGAEGLSGLLKQSRQSSHLHGIKVAPTAPAVNHLLFADDSLLFVKATVEGAMEVNDLLEKYCNASGHRINLEKSSVYFSKGCPEERRNLVKAALNVFTETLNNILECHLMWVDPRVGLSNILKIVYGRRFRDGSRSYLLWEGRKFS
jgi:hypothetical protein